MSYPSKVHKLFLSYFCPFLLGAYGVCHVVKVNILNANPPKLTAKTISKTVMDSAFLARAN